MIPWIVAHQAPLSMEFSRQEYWSGLPFPSPGDLPNPGIEPGSLTLQAVSLLCEPPGKPSHTLMCTQISQGSCYNSFDSVALDGALDSASLTSFKWYRGRWSTDHTLIALQEAGRAGLCPGIGLFAVQYSEVPKASISTNPVIKPVGTRQ